MSPLSSIPDDHQSLHSPSSDGTCVESTSCPDECLLCKDTTPVDVQAQSHTQDILSINDTVSNSTYDLLALPYPQLSESLSYPECYIPPEDNCVADVNVQHNTEAADRDTVSTSTPSDTARSCGSSDCVDAIYTADCSGPAPDGIRRRPGKEVGPPIEEAEYGGCVEESAPVEGQLEKAIRYYGSSFDRCTEGETSSQGARKDQFVYEQTGQSNITKFRFIFEHVSEVNGRTWFVQKPECTSPSDYGSVGETSSPEALQSPSDTSSSGQSTIREFPVILEQFPKVGTSKKVKRRSIKTIMLIKERCEDANCRDTRLFGIPIKYSDYYDIVEELLPLLSFIRPHFCQFNVGEPNGEYKSCDKALYSLDELSVHFTEHKLEYEDRKNWECLEKDCILREEDKPHWRPGSKNTGRSIIIRHIAGDLLQFVCPVDGCGATLSGSRLELARKHWDNVHSNINKLKRKKEEERAPEKEEEGEGEEEEEGGENENENERENGRNENGKRKRQRKQ